MDRPHCIARGDHVEVRCPFSGMAAGRPSHTLLPTPEAARSTMSPSPSMASLSVSHVQKAGYKAWAGWRWRTVRVQVALQFSSSARGLVASVSVEPWPRWHYTVPEYERGDSGEEDVYTKAQGG